MTRLGIAGALGRMGRAVGALALERADVVVAARLDRPGSEDTAAAQGPLASLGEALAACDVIIDFSTAEAAVALAAAAAERGGPALVVGATGFSPAQAEAVAAAAGSIAIVRSGNFSLGVNLLAALVERAARALAADDWDIEILEAHHRRKVDAPSGTALMLGEAAARGRGERLETATLAPRTGLPGARPAGGIGFASLRGGGIVGEHEVVFAAEDEVITLSHSARDRTLFARGALVAALWLRGRPPGLYDMSDVLGAVAERA